MGTTGSDGPLIFSTLTELLQHYGCRSLEDFEDEVDDFIRTSCEIDPEGTWPEPGFVVVIGNRGTSFVFPVSDVELWRSIDELEAEHICEIECEGLAQAIEIVEGFPVSIEVDQDPDIEADPSVNRRQVESGFWVQEIPEYPYRRAMTGSSTVKQWLDARFRPTYKGLDISIGSKNGQTTDGSWTLAEVRSRVRPR